MNPNEQRFFELYRTAFAAIIGRIQTDNGILHKLDTDSTRIAETALHAAEMASQVLDSWRTSQ